MRVEDIDFNVLLDEKSYENILTHDISYKRWCIDRFDKVDGIVIIYNETRYLQLFVPRI